MSITPAVLAKIANGEVEGDGEAQITGFAKIEEAKPGDVTFIANPKYAHYIDTTRASAVLVSRKFPSPSRSDVALIRVDDPYVALADLLKYFAPAPDLRGIEQPCFVAEGVTVPEDVYVGAFAYIGRGVTLAPGVKIYPHVYLGDGVSVGEDSVLRSGVKIYEGCSIGKKCIIHSGAVIGADGFGFAPSPEGYDKIPQIGNVIIEDDVEIGANTCVDRATFGSTVIGKGTKLDNLIQIAHNVTLGENNVFASQSGVAGSAKIGSWNRVGGQVGFAGHITVGDCNEFGAQSGIPNNVASHKRLMGYPAVDARQFAKNLVYIKRLDDLFNKR